MHLHIIAARANSPGVVEVGITEGRAERAATPPAPSVPFASTGPHGHRQRMRERLLARGPGALADYEVLEMLLFLSIPRRDTKPLAKAAINRFGSLRAVLLASADEIGTMLGPASAAALGLVGQAAERLSRAEVRDRPMLRDWAQLDGYLDAAPGAARLRVLYLNNRNQLLSDEALDAAPAVVSRDAVRRALALHATALILVVSRPGAAAPDKDELAMATRLKQAAGVLSIALHDVLLAGDGKRVSLRRKGVL